MVSNTGSDSLAAEITTPEMRYDDFNLDETDTDFRFKDADFSLTGASKMSTWQRIFTVSQMQQSARGSRFSSHRDWFYSLLFYYFILFFLAESVILNMLPQ